MKSNGCKWELKNGFDCWATTLNTQTEWIYAAEVNKYPQSIFLWVFFRWMSDKFRVQTTTNLLIDWFQGFFDSLNDILLANPRSGKIMTGKCEEYIQMDLYWCSSPRGASTHINKQFCPSELDSKIENEKHKIYNKIWPFSFYRYAYIVCSFCRI